MEFWLIQDKEKLQLPVPPSNYGIKTSNNNGSFVVEGLGEISFLGKSNLAQITPIVSFFPSQDYDFCHYHDFPSPDDCIRLIEKWRLNGKPIRYIITQTSVNVLCSIEAFEHGEDDGSGDINFTLELKEYRLINSSTKAVSSTAARPTSKKSPSKYTVVSGDTLYIIAKKFYGDGSKYKELASNNSIKDPSNLKIGTVLRV